MVRRAAEKAGIEGLDAILEGPTAVAFGYNDPVAPAKILVDFVAETKKTQIKGGVLAGKSMDVAEIKNLASAFERRTPGKDAGQPERTDYRPRDGAKRHSRNLVYALNAIKEKKEA